MREPRKFCQLGKQRIIGPIFRLFRGIFKIQVNDFVAILRSIQPVLNLVQGVVAGKTDLPGGKRPGPDINLRFSTSFRVRS